LVLREGGAKMEKIIFVEPLKKQFVVNVKDANRSARNRSFATASSCCGVRLKQQMLCSSCGGVVSRSDSTHKIVKIGKSDYLIDSQTLQQVQEQLESFEFLSLSAFLSSEPVGAQDRYDGLLYAFPVKKKESQYKELVSILRGRVAVGKVVLRSNEYQVIVSVGGDDVLRVRKLVSESQRYDFSPDFEWRDAVVNDQVVSLENQLLDKITVDTFDLTSFADKRIELEDSIIEEFVLHGRVPDVPKVVMQEQSDGELERLKALIEGLQ